MSARSIVVSGKLMDYDDEFNSSMQNQRAVEQLNQLLPDDIRVFSCKNSVSVFLRHASEQVVQPTPQYAHADIFLLSPH